MDKKIDREANLFEFFHEKIMQVSFHHDPKISEEGSFYLTSLLVERAQMPDESYPETMVELQLMANQGRNDVAVGAYKEMGDRALFISGFFRRSLERKLISPDYYMQMGSMAYSLLSGLIAAGYSTVFSELSRHFKTCSEILREVQFGLINAHVDFLQIYDEWVETK